MVGTGSGGRSGQYATHVQEFIDTIKKLVKSAIDVRCGEWVIWVQLDGESKRGATEG